MNISAPIRRLARLYPETVAIVRADDSTLSYRDLDRAIDRMAGHASALGLRAGDVAGLAVAGPDETLSLTLALALARVGVAIAAPSAPREHLRLCFEQNRATEPGNVAYNAAWLSEPAEPPGVAPDDGAALCQVFASSGTTGTPKHVPVSHELMARRVAGRWLGLSGGRATRIIATGLGSALGFETALRTLWAGGTLLLSNPMHAAGAMHRLGVTSIVASPAALRSILDALREDAEPPPALESIEIAGSVLPAPLHRAATARLCRRIVCDFGSTEADTIAAAPFDALAARAGAVGYAHTDCEVEAVDDGGAPLPFGEPGILRIRGDRVARGYLWDDTATQDGFRDGWFHSGDLGAVWPDGMVTLTGRVSELINSGGVKVSPHTIEAVLLTLPMVVDAAAFGVPDAEGIEQIWAAIVARTRIDDAVLNAFCQRALGGMSPRFIMQVKALPRNENGKVLRERLVELAKQRPA